jgi:hypothetical protein
MDTLHLILNHLNELQRSDSLQHQAIDSLQQVTAAMQEEAVSPAWEFWEARTVLFLIGFLATTLSMLVSNDVNERIKSGIFGTVLSGAVGIVITLLKDSEVYLLWSLLGSAFGGGYGWYRLWKVAKMAGKRYNFNSTIPQMELITGGLNSLRERVILIENQRFLDILKSWWQKSSEEFETKVNSLSENCGKESIDINREIKKIIYDFLFSVCNIHNAIYASNTVRASIIVFGKNSNQKTVGRHWIRIDDANRPFQATSDFEEDAIAAKVLSGKETNPRYVPDLSKEKEMPKRDNKGNRYKSFTVFKINDSCVLTIDWPKEKILRESEGYEKVVNFTNIFFFEKICPYLKKLFECWKGDLPQEVYLVNLSEDANAANAETPNLM